ncbi:hypothetical protein ACT4S5_07615 [Kocuria oceani]|uniref:hypothetical protein n=1 Tax=Kocuria oceani TaxID=988827 RepID=UPI00403713E3
MSVTIIRQWVGGGARHHHYETVEEAAEDTKDFIARHVDEDIAPDRLEAIIRGVIDSHCVQLDTRTGGIITGQGLIV